MKLRLLTAAAVITLALNSPWLLESANNNCAALERLGSRQLLNDDATEKDVALVAAGLAALSDGRMAATMAGRQRPGVPPTLTCLAAYWSKRTGGPAS